MRSKGDFESLLQILFDKINLPGGKSLAIAGTPQAFGPNLSKVLPPLAITTGSMKWGDTFRKLMRRKAYRSSIHSRSEFMGSRICGSRPKVC